MPAQIINFDDPTDRELILKIRDGDRYAFDIFYLRHCRSTLPIRIIQMHFPATNTLPLSRVIKMVVMAPTTWMSRTCLDKNIVAKRIQ